uniref:Uncharacterized protein n=1 Tax=Steinernema glaseri TaxID=37863 RepID=A0A1I7Z0P0_9BILA
MNDFTADANTEMLEATITYDQFGSQTFIASTPHVAKKKRKSTSPAVAQGEDAAPSLFSAPRNHAKAPRRSVAPRMSLIEEEPSSTPESEKTLEAPPVEEQPSEVLKAPRESAVPSVSPQEERQPE